MPDSILDVETPCLVADKRRLQANALRMRSLANAGGVTLRPHVKTTKSAEIARIAHDAEAGPITVSTLQEAEYFFEHGFRDICYAVAISRNKIPRALALRDRGADLKVLAASEQSASELAAATRERTCRLAVMLEIDSGEHRTGFSPPDPALLAAAQIVSGSDGLVLAGLLTHGGHSYAATSHEEIAVIAEEERSSLLEAKDRLECEGVAVDCVSSGSTPTAVFGKDFAGIDEIRPGVYIAGDLFQAQLGSLDIDDIAIAVLTTVIAHDVSRNRLIIDAGALALSKDRSTQNSPRDFGFGLVRRADGLPLPVEAIVVGVHQEHGEVGSDEPLPFSELPIGSLVRVLPNHACMTAAGYDEYLVTDGPDLAVVDRWGKTRGW